MLNVKKLLTKILTTNMVVEQGTNGIWTYRKWSNHTYDAWYVGVINLMAGTSWLGGYYHKTTSVLSPPSFSQNVTDMQGYANSDALNIYCGHTSNLETYWLNNTSSSSDNVGVRLDIHGTW